MSITYPRMIQAASESEQCITVWNGSGERCTYRHNPDAVPCVACGGRLCFDCGRVERHDSIACKIRQDGRPFVGAPASYGYASDSYPATVIAVSKSGHRITLQSDRTEVVSGSVLDGSAKWICTPDANGSTVEATRRKDGRYRIVGCSNYGTVTFGRGRRAYRDPSF